MILTSADITANSKVGAKTLNLKKLLESGFNVPEFIAIPADITPQLFNADLSDLTKEISKTLPSQSYAVRSSALIEDSSDQSFAGQFKTEIDVAASELDSGIQKVLSQAHQYLDNDLSKFSIIIQKYIPATYAGITFTRNPSQGREMVIEYHQGIGEQIVSGEVTPEKISLYWTQPIDKASLPNFEKAIGHFKSIEELFNSPQDIEWCISDNTWYFLQSRPITTINDSQYLSSKYLDEHLPKESFFYEKTEISEIAPTPTTFTLSLLKEIYKQTGPIAAVYKKHKLSYEYQNFFVHLGRELFIDREKEIQTLFPAYSYLKKNYEPHLSHFSGLWRTFKNTIYLNQINLEIHTTLEQKVIETLQTKKSDLKFSEALKSFLDDYQTIFEINLLSQKAVQNLSQSIKHQQISVADILATKIFDEQNQTNDQDLINQLSNLKGNALEISDTSKFTANTAELKENKRTKNWFNSLSNIKQTYFKKIIIPAQKFNRLREYGRWLTVKNINLLRSSILELADQNSFKNSTLIYFAKIDELLQNHLNESECQKRQEEHLKFSNLTFPSSLTYHPIQKTKQLEGVSSGTATGEIVDINGPLKDNILYTQTLSPELTEHFDQIAGIISEEGGLLSHLAIIAREQGIPVIVNCNLNKLKITIGDTITIDGSNSTINKLNKS